MHPFYLSISGALQPLSLDPPASPRGVSPPTASPRGFSTPLPPHSPRGVFPSSANPTGVEEVSLAQKGSSEGEHL